MGYELCCIGHITLDKVVTPSDTVHMAGGTAYYFSQAVAALDVAYLLVTAVADSELRFVNSLQKKGITVDCLPSAHTVFFENHYNRQNQRTQKVLQQADAFKAEQLSTLEAAVFHLGPLLADDLPDEGLRLLADKGKVSLDVQGLLRKVESQNVQPIDWKSKHDLLPCVYFLKASEREMTVLTGCTDVYEGAKMLAQWGVKEVIITMGGKGSIVYTEGDFYQIPAYKPVHETDATGCGDTYMAGYLYQRIRGAGIQQAGEFGAAMATLKLEQHGPFAGAKEDVEMLLTEMKEG